MIHRTRVSKISSPFVPHKRGSKIFGNTDAVFEHAAEISHGARMAPIGSIQIICDCLQALVPQTKRSAELEHKSRIGRIGSKGRSTCCLYLRGFNLCGR